MLSRVTAVRRLPRAFATPARLYSDSRSEGSVAQSKGFNKKEKAHEDQFIHRHEQEQLAKMRAQIDAKNIELDALKKQEAELAKKAEKE
ncbi:hypothetical protein GALMADRAFT_250767 [Galerina marginata CBS 339.88]|uniref:ATPase inhibitor, mitochondrial n=1 Tax=Galerina marginata (strain CBS 339.88) TaxID=685588 RepID=A0A067SVH2_GALM3|nr:hypothetical protein GALMADRAFT_250767 [Galerina marginata CBS 339.88]